MKRKKVKRNELLYSELSFFMIIFARNYDNYLLIQKRESYD